MKTKQRPTFKELVRRLGGDGPLPTTALASREPPPAHSVNDFLEEIIEKRRAKSETFDDALRQAEKQRSRDRDQERLDKGEVTPEELRKEIASFHLI